MTTPSDKYKVGYGRPPVHTRWKKGQSGNPRKRPKREESTVEMIDRLLFAQVELKLSGELKRISALEAIVSQLQVKELSGNTRASRILLKYKEFANRHAERQVQVVFKGDPM